MKDDLINYELYYLKSHYNAKLKALDKSDDEIEKLTKEYDKILEKQRDKFYKTCKKYVSYTLSHFDSVYFYVTCKFDDETKKLYSDLQKVIKINDEYRLITKKGAHIMFSNMPAMYSYEVQQKHLNHDEEISYMEVSKDMLSKSVQIPDYFEANDIKPRIFVYDEKQEIYFKIK
ncbi:hypothetical protein OFO10_02200 [Campylobacter sp. VBCF_06 NA8]|uniref:hypothetical protein n=1 Tax=unclassified Campylobacter TaxID=2593542 RepID=UPI0022E9C4B1|nr:MULTISPECIES: hypothetical protein [unclassified Campylobacter]MDA3043189.1 hypothetical protein [Campylobacter sp. JMF_09 ED2]MDA3044773.1 hypothetical protein [Campylobacter sp. JMF_07 ED4]MDA3045966.1 hypothetical protein [Campylobacter sp. VBCF_06 NA8]MDA3063809.1 hypothetical protein [Campylobacter sp. JMF_11 EL3]MDA3072142.1 hypothetical protein [Campylobacter sp. VBCF_03 NA9]